MSGKRQHFVPRFLQEGFASHVTNRGVFTWVHRKGAASFNTNIINIGVEGKFYTTEQDTTVDDLITAAEGPFGSLIASLRKDASQSLADPQLPHLIAHLETRTRHLRESFLQTGEMIVSRLLDFLSDEEAFAAYMTKRLQRDSSVLRQSLAEEFAKRGIPNHLLEPAMQLSMPLVPALVHNQRSEFSKLARMLRSTMPEILKNAAKTGHIRALSGSVISESRVQRYEALSYSVVRSADAQLILGDSIVLFSVDGPRHYKAFLDKDDVLNAVFLPLDTGRVLIGSHQGNFNTIPSDLRDAIVRCSLEYFIASDSSSKHEILKGQIGADAYLLTQNEIEDMLSDIWQE